ncbi:hypothetical protein ABZP36_004285 [Zizania latifolia]
MLRPIHAAIGSCRLRTLAAARPAAIPSRDGMVTGEGGQQQAAWAWRKRRRLVGAGGGKEEAEIVEPGEAAGIERENSPDDVSSGREDGTGKRIPGRTGLRAAVKPSSTFGSSSAPGSV